MTAVKQKARAKVWLNIVLMTCIVLALYFLRGHHRAIETKTHSVSGDYITARLQAQKLDQIYLSRLVSEANSHESAHRALVGEEPNFTSNYTASIVVGRLSSEEERTQWIFNKLQNIQNREIYVVDDNSTSLPHLDINHGREAAVYLKYIVEQYDQLSDVTFFWHNDEVVWHNNLLFAFDSVESINRMDRENIRQQGYVPSRCDHWPGCPTWIRFNPSMAEHRLDPHRLESLFNLEIFEELFPNVEEFPPFFAGTCCSQFAVSRDQIRTRPKEHYEHLFKWAVEYPDDAESGRVFEYAWPFIFTGRGTWCPSMQECYCKTYNFCMEDQQDIAELEFWNSVRTRREEVQWQLNFIQDALETEKQEHGSLGASLNDIAAIEQRFAPEIDRLREHLVHLVRITWEARENIIRYWKLPPPPVGW